MGIIEKRGADRTARIEFLKKRPNCLSSMGQRSCAVTNIVDGMERREGDNIVDRWKIERIKRSLALGTNLI